MTELLLEAILEEDCFTELLLEDSCFSLELETTLLLDELFIFSLDDDLSFSLPDDDFSELLQDPSWLSPLRMTLDEDSSQSSQALDEESFPGRTKLLSSSSQAASASVNARANTRRTDPRLHEDDCRNVVTT